ncbi:hypothetical protein AB4Y64_13140 [Lysobacter sp. TAF61]|uniref:hypothetical protein n=1 Tax=Lysobacter sp. TAF61 TaxID=3233072 RepID=UPI003F99B232
MDRLARTARPDQPPIVVTAFGFTVGPAFVAWQAVAEIRAYDADPRTKDAAFLEFSCGGQSVRVSVDQPGFDGLEQVMAAVFPATAGWRQSVASVATEQGWTLLFRRG